ncbi:MAG: hypothetical protein Q4P33_09635 [Flaviflexus sp.]|nr:hypothetical protein [Flaviflexus sp.]
MDSLWSTLISAVALIIAAISAFAAVRSSRASQRANALAAEANAIAQEALELQVKETPPVWSALEEFDKNGLKIQNTSGEDLVLREMIVHPIDFQPLLIAPRHLPLHVSNGDYVHFRMMRVGGSDPENLLIRFSRKGSNTIEEERRLLP